MKCLNTPAGATYTCLQESRGINYPTSSPWRPSWESSILCLLPGFPFLHLSHHTDPNHCRVSSPASKMILLALLGCSPLIWRSPSVHCGMYPGKPGSQRSFQSLLKHSEISQAYLSLLRSRSLQFNPPKGWCVPRKALVWWNLILSPLLGRGQWLQVGREPKLSSHVDLSCWSRGPSKEANLMLRFLPFWKQTTVWDGSIDVPEYWFVHSIPTPIILFTLTLMMDSLHTWRLMGLHPN